MPLPVGSRLGPYEIHALIGAGGMGEVYRAIDTRLSRTVAIKVLPSHLASDPERRQRLEREARIVSSLDHPSICALYDVGHENGRDFLVMQHLEGETLADRLKKGPLPVERALAYAADTADALSAAHRLGIVHRDLKPGNLMLTKSGVRVLDFGLARLVDSGAVSRGSDAHDTVAVVRQADRHAVTEEGVVLGTVQYMAPEQVQGRLADARTDIFALGAVLFEMMTGRRAFEAPSTTTTMAAILDADAPPVSSLRSDAPASLDRVIRKCLAKDPEARWQSARDLADELRWIQQADTASTAVRGGTRRRPIRTALLALVAALAIAAAVVATDRLRRIERPPPEFARLTFHRGTISNARFSPDGRTIVYSASWEGRTSEVFMTAAGSPESRSLGVRDAELMSVSGTGELAMLRSDGVLAVSPLTGARSPRDMAANVFDADWSPNGELAAIRRWDPRQGLTPLEFPLGHPIGGSALKTSAQRIRVARDGKRVVISEQPLIAETSRLRLVDVSGDVRDLGTWSSMTGFSFSPDGREIWLSGARAGSGPVLWAVGLTGNARVLARFPGEPVLMDVASDGRALIAIVERRTHMTAVVDGQERDLSWLGASGVRGITDDGRTIVFEDVGDAPGAARSVWIRTIDGAQATRLGEGRPLDIAPQGQWVAATNTGPPAKLVIYPTGPGTPRVLVEGAQDYPGATFLQNGRGLLVVETPMPDQRSPLPFAFKLFDLTSGAVTAIGSDAGPIHVRHAVAPDGRSLIVKRQGGAFFVVPLDGSAWKWDTLQPIPGLSEQDFVKEWTEEGVYTQQFDPRALRIDRVQIPSGARSTWKTLAPADASGVERPGAGGFFAMTPDARTYVYSFSRALSTLYLVDGLK